MKRFLHILIALAVFHGLVPLQASPSSEALKSVKRMVSYIRYSETKPVYSDRALDLIDFDAISRYLLDSSYESASVQQKQRFKELLREYIRLNAFPRAVQYFKDIDLTYDAPVQKNDSVHIHSSLLYGASERIHFTWVLEKQKKGFRIVDVLNENHVSSMQLNRDKQVQPLLKKRGLDGLLDQFEKIVESLR